MKPTEPPKFWSIRYQIALPLLAIQAFFALMTAIIGARAASNRVETEIIGRLEGLSNVLSSPQFPLTQSVLQRLNQLTGAHFIATNGNDIPTQTSLPALPPRVPQFKSYAGTLGDAPRGRYLDMDYFSVEIPIMGQNRRLIALYPVSLWRQTRRDALVLPIFMGLAGLLAMSAVTTLVAGRIASRLGLVESGVAKIAAGQFEELSLDHEKSDEIEHLAASINHMSRQIQEMQNTIETTGRMRLLAQIASGLAHQLRNSIAGARMAIQLHFKRCPSASGDTSISIALKQLQLTEEQIRGLISQNPLFQAESEMFDLAGLIREIISLLEFHAQHAGVRLHFETIAEVYEIQGIPAEYRTALFNLVNNAIEAARTGGDVWIDLIRMESGTVRLRIMDNGPGFSDRILNNIGQPFVSTKPEGLGLGLYLARQVADRHQNLLHWRREADITVMEWIWPADCISPATASTETTHLGQAADR